MPCPAWDAARHMTVVADQLRYSKGRAGRVRQDLIGTIIRRHPAAKVSMAFGNSAEVAGLQVADAVANSAFQVSVASPASKAVESMLAPLLASGVLTIHDVQLDGHRPAWLMGR